MTCWPSSLWLALLLAGCVAAIGQAAEQSVPTASAQGEDFFEKHVRPVLIERCYKCHSAEAEKLKADLRLDSREGLLKGGESGKPAIVPGDAGRSLLIEAIRQTNPDLKMPPPNQGSQLSARQIDDFVAWVNAGAPMPATSELANRKPQTASRQHWAFQPPKPPPLPEVKNRAWAQTPVDLFILAKLEANTLKPSPATDPRTLIRRMTYDLTGLPPTPAEVEAFATECSLSHRPIFPPARGESERVGKRASERKATERLVERLLASPHYGERWGRHWLDVARYADTKGYVYGREERFFVHAYAYRDWVIQAFNNDLPYDHFLRLQIAADQLVPPHSPDLAAMGFVTGGRRFIGVTRDIIDDRIDVVTRGTMALTVQCARCHDHKYDPIPTQDYYALYGVFHNSNEHLVPLARPTAQTEANAAYEKEYQARAKKFADTMSQRRDEAAARLRARVGEYLNAQLELNKYPEEGFDQILTADDIIPASVRRWRDFQLQTQEGAHPIFAPWHALASLPAKDFAARASAVLEQMRRQQQAALNPLVAAALVRPPKSMREVAQRYGELFADAEKRWQATLGEAKNAGSPPPSSLPDAGAEALRRFLYDPHSPTAVPDVGIVNNESFFPTAVCEELWKLQGEVDRWIIRAPASPDHALVLVDGEPEPNPRVFKRGNPATKGEEVPRRFLQVVAGPNRQPFKHGSGRLELAQAIASADNPLTARVMVNRVWMHHFGAGLVRTPSDFGLRAGAPSHPKLLDWLALRFIESGWSVKQMHRLILLSATYQQQSTADGLPAARSIDPENHLVSHFNRQRLDFEEMRDALLAVSGELDPRLGGKPAEMFAAANHRPSVYGLVDRQFLPGAFRVFDFANPDLHIPQRHETTVSQQALFFLNNAFIADRAKALAAQLEFRLPQPASAGRVRFLYQALYQREPTARELEAGLRFVATAEADLPPPSPKPRETAWQYGWGEYDDGTKRVKDFHPLPHFTGEAWQGGSEWPDGKLGWAQFTAAGGHPGNDLQHACIRRWIASQDACVTISGLLTHEPEAGDGIRAFIASSRHGTLKSSVAHHSKADMAVEALEVKAGDALDFVVDIRAGLNSDQFLWSPINSTLAATTGHSSQAVAKSWDAKKEFAGPAEPYAPPLKPWEQYAQVLLLANEFLFVD